MADPDAPKSPQFAFLHSSPVSTESSADRLLCRNAPGGYLEDWKDFVSNEHDELANEHTCPLVVFKVCDELLAIPTAVVGQVTDLKPVHQIPHQRGSIIRGVTNVNGRLRLFMSMSRMLEIGGDEHALGKKSKKPMMVIENEGEVWAFAVADVCGTHNCDLRTMKNVPVNVAKSTANYLRGVFAWQGHDVGLIDDELLFFSLRRGGK